MGMETMKNFNITNEEYLAVLETPKDVVTMCNDGRKFVIVKTYQE